VKLLLRKPVGFLLPDFRRSDVSLDAVFRDIFGGGESALIVWTVFIELEQFFEFGLSQFLLLFVEVQRCKLTLRFRFSIHLTSVQGQ